MESGRPVAPVLANAANAAPLLATPFSITTTAPGVAPADTGSLMLVSLHDVGVAKTPLKVTVLLPCVAPKYVPAMVTGDPTGPKSGVRLAIAGGEADDPTPQVTHSPRFGYRQVCVRR